MYEDIFGVFPVIFKTFVFAESNISYIEIQDGIYSTLRHLYEKIPSEVVFRGQRESDYVKVKISSVEPFSVCEVEAIGNIFFLQTKIVAWLD